MAKTLQGVMERLDWGKNCASASMNPVHLSFGRCFFLFFFNSLLVDAIIRSMFVCRLTRGRPTQQFVVAD